MQNNIQVELKKIKKDLDIIKKRNLKVELDKKWESSWSRKIVLGILTYLAIALYLFTIDITRPWLNAIVPTVGFLLSTLTLPFFKKIWQSRIKK